MKRSGVFANSVLWFGAAISIAEIEAGFSMGGNWTALVAGHLLGGFLLFAAGLLGARTRKNAMETTADSFGKGGMRFFAALNIVQLVGWTAVMISQGAQAVSALSGIPLVYPALGLTLLIGLWLFIAFADKFHLVTLAMGLLALLSIALTWKLFGLHPAATPPTAIGFWPAFEASIAMPLSWLPLISDYTSTAERPRASTTASAVVYTMASLWMYALGMMLARIGAPSISDGIRMSGIGSSALCVVVFSTVTTTFLDAYSAGESAKAILPKGSPRIIGVSVCALGGILAIASVMDHYLGFLYLIASVFAPMATVLLIDRYLMKRGCILVNIAAWLIGFATYQFAGTSPIGPTLTAMLASALAAGFAVLVRKPHA